MDEVLSLILIIVGFISFIPVVNMIKNNKDSKYRCLKFLMNSTFLWTILIFIERISISPFIVYYAHMLGYPLKFLVSAFMLCTIFNYTERKMPKYAVILLGFIFVLDYLVAITNSVTKYILQLSLSEFTSFADLYTSSNGPIFIYHLIITYLVLVVAIGYFIYFLTHNRGVRQYKAVSKTMIYSILIVLFFNMLQLFVVETTVDLTYISLVIVSYALYQVIYANDMIFNLLSSGRGKILTNMRELYILTDSEKRVVEFSELLSSKYQIKVDDFIGKSLDVLLKHLEDKTVLYQEYDVNGQHQSNKDHFHLRERKFFIKGKNYGYMILLYDETKVFKLLRELNQLSNYDMMTGLNNRNYMENKLDTYNNQENLGIISLDLNGLKVNNDYLGHERGDYLLKTLADNIKSVLVNIDHKEIARIGGDEFLIILPAFNQENLEKVKNDILQKCDDDELEKRISVSIGSSYDLEGKQNIYQLIQNADSDMYAMKNLTSKIYSKEIVAYAKRIDKFIR